MRKRRYYTRIKSREVQKKHALKVLKRREEVQELIKLGKMPERRERTRPSPKRIIEMSSFSLVNKTRRTSVRRLPFKKIKEPCSGKNYDLSVALVGPKESREITLRSKKKNKVSNVLAFPLSKNSGEIILCPQEAGKDARLYVYPRGATSQRI
jgi:hypothetical protein